MKRDTWQLKVLWLSSNYPKPSRIWYEIINHLEINKAFNMVAIIERVSQMRRGKPIRFNKRRHKYEIATDDRNQR
jgi:hypothetical protein